MTEQSPIIKYVQDEDQSCRSLVLKLIITHQNSKQALVRRKTTLMPWNTKTQTAIVWIKDEITIIIHLHLLIT
jgi:hypothetical protein